MREEQKGKPVLRIASDRCYPDSDPEVKLSQPHRAFIAAGWAGLRRIFQCAL